MARQNWEVTLSFAAMKLAEGARIETFSTPIRLITEVLDARPMVVPSKRVIQAQLSQKSWPSDTGLVLYEPDQVKPHFFSERRRDFNVALDLIQQLRGRVFEVLSETHPVVLAHQDGLMPIQDITGKVVRVSHHFPIAARTVQEVWRFKHKVLAYQQLLYPLSMHFGGPGDEDASFLEEVLLRDARSALTLAPERSVVSLADQLSFSDKNSLMVRLQLALQAGVALHERGFVHNDIKLDNIFFDSKTAGVLLGDFEMAQPFSDPQEDVHRFTPGYFDGEFRAFPVGQVSAHRDTFAFGMSILGVLARDSSLPPVLCAQYPHDVDDLLDRAEAEGVHQSSAEKDLLRGMLAPRKERIALSEAADLLARILEM